MDTNNNNNKSIKSPHNNETSSKKFSFSVSGELKTFEGIQDGELNLSIQLDSTASQQKQRNLVLILVVDRSGSMSGTFERQVVPALKYIVESCYNANIEIEIIVYESNALRLKFDQKNYQKVISALHSGGGTNFDEAFAKLGDVLNDVIIRKNRTDYDVVVGFMTDGCGTYTKKSFNHLKQIIENTKTKVVVHSVAFAAEHDFNLLNQIRQTLGTVEGGFQYAEPSDGEDALRQKLEAIFEVVSNSAGDLNFECELQNFNFLQFLPNGKSESKSKWSSTVTLDKSGFAQLTLFVNRTITTNAPPAALLLKFSGSMNNKSMNGEVELKNVTVQGQTAAHLFKLKQIESTIDALNKVIADSVSKGEVQVSTRETWSKNLEKISNSIKQYTGANLLKEFKKSERTTSLEIVMRINQKIQSLNEVLTSLARGEISTAQKARLAEITYGHKFAAVRTQRKMDERVQRNIVELKKQEEELKNVSINKEIVKSIPEDTAEVYKCILTQASWTDLVCDDLQSRDVVGFGLAVERNELVIEDPTQIRISQVSLTVLSKSAFEDALKYSIDLSGHLASHGGFNESSEMGVALRGMGREPINSWLPLFIHPEHWKLVCPQLKAILGHFVTLDPFGYNENQIDALFLVMATMIARLSKEPGERELLLLYQFHRTMFEIVKTFRWQGRLLSALTRWVESPKNRLKDSTKNLLVFISYLLCLPLESLSKHLPSEDSWTKLWLTLLEETVRRGADNITKNFDDNRINQILDAFVLYEAQTTPQLTPQEINSHPVMNTKEAANDWKATPTKQTVSTTPIKKKDNNNRNPQAFKMDRGSGKTSSQQSLYKPEGWKRSRRQRRPPRQKQRVLTDEGRDKAAVQAAQEIVYKGALPGQTGAEQSISVEYNPSYITLNHLNALEEFVKKLNQRGHPTIHALMTLMTYTRQWIKMQESAGGLGELFSELDKNAGVAPKKWIQLMKEAFKARENLRSSFTGFFQLCPLPPTADHPVLVMRAMSAQAIKLASNKNAKDAIDKGTYLDPISNSAQILKNLALQQTYQKLYQDKATAANTNYDYAVERCVNCLDMVTFVGFLVSEEGFKGRRNIGAFKTLCQRFIDNDAKTIPLGFEKLKVLITGKVEVQHQGTIQSYPVLDNGTVWIPSKKRSFRKRLEKIWGAPLTQFLDSLSPKSAKK